MYLVEDDKKKYRVRYSRRPCQDVCPRREKYGYQPQRRADEFDIAYRAVKDGKKSLFDVKESVEAGKIGHVLVDFLLLGTNIQRIYSVVLVSLQTVQLIAHTETEKIQIFVESAENPLFSDMIRRDHQF